ncbi:alpha/beta hydrolase [Sandaracinobacteroides saxicola]|uniref:Proline iminopeptidase n=1 Tax=Sandaracinobacteroides saxicola TaxID=2759707 RepID=A0A7G5IGU3_9SPHN|nr:alpha/beta hydrolase [Sandaracinobacteroides saxicola]QMW22585.1 alpha/beta hydrolase [Sandaracinobacteroides saxicola]
MQMSVGSGVVRRFAGWLGFLLACVVGAAAVFGVLYLFAPVAPALWTLLMVPLLVGTALAWLLARMLGPRLGLRPATAGIAAALIAALPLTGLITAMLLSPAQPRAAPGVDPRGPHQTLRTPAGSAIAWWSLPPAVPKHRTPVIFLHGGPGTFIRPRDFAVGDGFRAAGFRTVFYDQSGSGASGLLPAADYTLARAVADLDALRAALGAEKLVLWGQSWGASLAAAYARAHPDRVAATVLDSPGDFPGEPLPLDYSATDTDGGFQPTLRDATLYLLIGHAPQLAEQWQTQRDAQAVGQARANRKMFMYGYQCKGAPAKLPRPASPGGGNLYPQLLLQNDLERQAKVTGPLSTAPMLLIRPACDFIPAATTARYMAAYPAARRIDVPGRGHGFFGHDAELRALLQGFAAKDLAQLP